MFKRVLLKNWSVSKMPREPQMTLKQRQPCGKIPVSRRNSISSYSWSAVFSPFIFLRSRQMHCLQSSHSRKGPQLNAGAGRSSGSNQPGLYWSLKLSVCVHVCLHVSVCVHMYVAAILLASFWSCLTTFPVVQMGWAQGSSFSSTATIPCHAVSLYVSQSTVTRFLCTCHCPYSVTQLLLLEVIQGLLEWLLEFPNRKLSREISSMQRRGLCLSYLELCVSKMSLDTKDLLIPVITNSLNHNSRFMEIQEKQHNGVSRPPW